MTTEAIFKLLKGERLLWLRLKKHTEYTERAEFIFCVALWVQCENFAAWLGLGCASAQKSNENL